MWFRWFENYPRPYKVVAFGVGSGLGALCGLVGLIAFIASKFTNMDALICAVIGLIVYLCCRKLEKWSVPYKTESPTGEETERLEEYDN